MHHLLVITLLASSQVVLSSPVGVVVGLSPHAFDPIESLYHAQDKSGQYVYGYATPTATKSETKSADGVTRGGYSYIDGNGYLQTVEYTADALHGFRVAATNLPKDLPDVAYARAKHLSDFEAIRAEHEQIRAVAYSNPVAIPIHSVPAIPIHQQLPQPVTDLPEVVKARNQHLAALHAAYANVQIAPQPVQDLPEVVKARAEHLAVVAATRQEHAALQGQVVLGPVPETIEAGVIPVRTASLSHDAHALPVAPATQVSYAPIAYESLDGDQRHQQEAWRPYSYGYVGPFSAHSESRALDGVTRGGYSYIDANGIIQNVQYVADAGGFRVAASNIPVDVNHIKQARAPVVYPPAVEEHVGKIVVKAVEPTQVYNHEIVY